MKDNSSPETRFTISEDNATLKIFKRIKIHSDDKPIILRKIFLFVSITWIPLLILTLLDGTALSNQIRIPFLHDFVTYTKFLVTLPLLFVAESFIKFLTGKSINYFVDSDLITEETIGEYEELVNKYRKFQNSRKAELVLIILAVVFLINYELFFKSFGNVSSWKFFVTEDSKLTLAGYWYTFISFPVTQYLIFRMIWKFIIWTMFLWKVSRMDLNLSFCDPDRAGGLSFLGPAQMTFGILGFAQAASFSAQIADKVIYSGIPFEDFKQTIIIIIPLVSLFYLFPLFFFTKKLSNLKVKGILDYGILAHKYGKMFETKWIYTKDRGKNTDEITDDENNKEPLLGTGDIQSLADLGGSFERIEEIRLVPFNIKSAILMLLLIAFPFLPLATLIVPLPDILKGLMGFLL